MGLGLRFTSREIKSNDLSSGGATISACRLLLPQTITSITAMRSTRRRPPGLLLIALMLLILTLVRYWHDIHWSLR